MTNLLDLEHKAHLSSNNQLYNQNDVVEEIKKQPSDFDECHSVGRELEGLPISEPSHDCSDNLLPDGFEIKVDGLYYKGQWVCAKLIIKAFVRDPNNEDWRRVLEFQDPDGNTHTVIIPGADLTAKNFTNCLQKLLEKGFRVNPKMNLSKYLLDYIINTQVNGRLKSLSKNGWHDRHFALGKYLIPKSLEFYIQHSNMVSDFFTVRGSFEEWIKNVASPCKGNSRFVFSLSAGFSAILLPLIGHETIGFNLLGPSSTGKSTTLSVAASIYGSPRDIQQWKVTSNGLEALASFFNHCMLCLDEMGQANPATLGNDIYALSNGSSKVRMTKEIQLRKVLTWVLLYLSSGELSVEQILAEAGKKAKAGMMIRNMDIPADAGKGFGIFDTLHNFENGHEFSCFLKNNAAQYHGTAIREFLTRLIDAYPDFSTLKPLFKIVEKQFIADNVPENADGQVKRAAMHFAVVAWGGELAIHLGVLPYAAGEALTAAKDCFQAWLENRGTSHSYEEQEIVQRVQAFIQAHHSTRFATLGLDQGLMTEKIYNQAGYKRKNDSRGFEFCIFKDVFHNEICKGLNLQKSKKILAETGMLVRDSQGKYTISIYAKDFGGPVRMICIVPYAFAELD